MLGFLRRSRGHSDPATMARNWKTLPNARFIDRMKGRSMLHQETLALLDYYARQARHGILEIGTYMGGATAVMARALVETDSAIPMISIEAGGKHDNPHLPSDDILADLRTTLSDQGVLQRVRIIEGWSNEPKTVAAVSDILGSRKIDLIVIDADGAIARDFAIYRPVLCDDAVIVLDDYRSDEAQEKELPVRQWVDAAMASGLVSEIGVFLWGTWFGRLNPAAPASAGSASPGNRLKQNGSA